MYFGAMFFDVERSERFLNILMWRDRSFNFVAHLSFSTASVPPLLLATDGMDVLFTARPLAWRVSPPAVGDKKGFFTAKPLAWRVSSPIVRPLLLLEAGAILEDVKYHLDSKKLNDFLAWKA